jgi:hypothetical protein
MVFVIDKVGGDVGSLLLIVDKLCILFFSMFFWSFYGMVKEWFNWGEIGFIFEMSEKSWVWISLLLLIYNFLYYLFVKVLLCSESNL